MKIIDLIKGEFIKNFKIKKIIIVLIILLLSIVGKNYIDELKITNDNKATLEQSVSYFKNQLDFYKSHPDTNQIKKEWYLFSNQKNYEMYNKLLKSEKYNNLSTQSWQHELSRRIVKIDTLVFWIEKYKVDKNVDVSWIKDDYEFTLMYQNYLEKLSNMNIEELNQEQEMMLKTKSDFEDLFKDNKYYKYIEYMLNNKIDDAIGIYNISELEAKYYKVIIDNKVEEESYLVKNIDQLRSLGTFTYESKRANNLRDSILKKDREILEYSIDKVIKQDISYGAISVGAESIYISTKSCVNGILDLSIVVMILVVLLDGNIVSKEHNKGTEKLLLTTSNKRWKILLSKFLYLILETYIIWFTALLLILLFAGLKYGFNDLITPKILYQNGKIIEVNYIIYIIKQIFYCSIPVLAFISIVFMISTITLNSGLTNGLCMIFAIISPFMWHFIYNYHLSLLSFLPFPYFMFSSVITVTEDYLGSVDVSNASEVYGIIISLVTFVTCYIISNIVFIKRDVKN